MIQTLRMSTPLRAINYQPGKIKKALPCGTAF
uniref:Uncharacterized protein n=1 Tax=Erwinia amylovora ATCC BAA-2158 TaxID=889211 RepID=E5B1P8_ERWAM|nr:hypothetical protein predicted by Glimmer/Critica [Erwinia amylovora ATCC BAA-2158]